MLLAEMARQRLRNLLQKRRKRRLRSVHLSYASKRGKLRIML